MGWEPLTPETWIDCHGNQWQFDARAGWHDAAALAGDAVQAKLWQKVGEHACFARAHLVDIETLRDKYKV